MKGGTHIKVWVDTETKRRFAALAHAQGISESALLKRSIDLLLQSASATQPVLRGTELPEIRGARLSVRLRPDDQLLLRERAAKRGIPAATYISLLVRAHLRAVAPLPKAELAALTRTIAELGAVGRNLNQIARAVNLGERVGGPSKEDLKAILRACEALRDHVRGLVAANLKAWEVGYAEASC